MSYTERPSDEFIALLKKSGDNDQNVAYAAQREFAKALEEQGRQEAHPARDDPGRSRGDCRGAHHQQ